jgi:hypothetical protein
MRLLFGLLTYLIAVVAIVGGTAAFLSSVVEPVVRMGPAQQDTPKVAPRVQAWLDRNAEGLVYAEKEKTAAFAEQERAEALRITIPSMAEHSAMARAHDKEGKQTAQRESAPRATERKKREAKRRSRQPEQIQAGSTRQVFLTGYE